MCRTDTLGVAELGGAPADNGSFDLEVGRVGPTAVGNWEGVGAGCSGGRSSFSAKGCTVRA